MSDAVWPIAFNPGGQEFYLATLTTVFGNPYSAAAQVLERDGQRWVCRMTLRRGSTLAREIDAFLAGLRGPVGTVLVPDFRTRAARGSLAGAPHLADGAGRSLTVTGFAPGAAGVLLPGDLIQTSPGRGHIVTAPVDADGNGAATAPVEPRLRAPVTVGPLATQDVRVRMRLTSDDAGRNPTRPPRRSEWQLEFVEVLEDLD